MCVVLGFEVITEVFGNRAGEESEGVTRIDEVCIWNGEITGGSCLKFRGSSRNEFRNASLLVLFKESWPEIKHVI